MGDRREGEGDWGGGKKYGRDGKRDIDTKLEKEARKRQKRKTEKAEKGEAGRNE